MKRNSVSTVHSKMTLNWIRIEAVEIIDFVQLANDNFRKSSNMAGIGAKIRHNALQRISLVLFSDTGKKIDKHFALKNIVFSL